MTSEVDVVGIDEAQFFDDSIVEVCRELADSGVRVIVAGLDMDYTGKPFGPMPALMATAEYVTKVHAICVRCGNLAHSLAPPHTGRKAGRTGRNGLLRSHLPTLLQRAGTRQEREISATGSHGEPGTCQPTPRKAHRGYKRATEGHFKRRMAYADRSRQQARPAEACEE